MRKFASYLKFEFCVKKLAGLKFVISKTIAQIFLDLSLVRSGDVEIYKKQHPSQ